ncbi:cation:proton antiporter [Parachlamydia sp. AcF125]|uniref:cation:proton antiporter n=1 Tax=Parachlamydia sp. AcF125 TaxID=2795736 RepID=UPI001BC8D43F|nr:cation:proton antiporter [Parachlamydia sp. AcF125]MBS4168215.1 putative cation/proton antiporter YbaL [Parachlamydia sp. AcF125]
MDTEIYRLKIVLVLTIGFALAGLLGYLSLRMRLSPLLGYLLAGYVIGPYSPGFVTEIDVSEQLAEIGVIMMMFGVGLHFKLEDLSNVKMIAIPGAIGQTLGATIVATFLMYYLGWPLQTGIILGLAIGVASTVVLVRVLSDFHLLHTLHGKISVGWLIVEDILTVIMLILLPVIATLSKNGNFSFKESFYPIVIALSKFALLTILVFTIGKKLVIYLLSAIEKTKSKELFTVAILALTFGIATASALVFGASIAMGAFMAGMIIGQSEVKHLAFKHAAPLRNAFVVTFFLSVGTLFNPSAMWEFFPLFISILGIILIIKPLVAFLIAIAFKQSLYTATVVGLALAQVGEFSFILAEEAMRLKLLPDEGYDVIVAAALISIAINPLLFKLIETPLPDEHEGEEQFDH